MALTPTSLEILVSKAHALLAASVTTAPLSTAPVVVFFSFGDATTRAQTLSAFGADFASAWQAGTAAVSAQVASHGRAPTRLRVDAVDQTATMTWGGLKTRLGEIKRNYLGYGIAFDTAFQTAFLPEELNASGVFYSAEIEHAHPNAVNMRLLGKRRFGRDIEFPEGDDAPIHLFTTRAVYADAEGAWALAAEGPSAGLRLLPDWGAREVRSLLERGSDYLARQVKDSGEFHYGWFPFFDRAIPTYNTLRHASSTYALLEAWELTQDAQQKQAIDRSLAYLTGRLIHEATLPDGTAAAFLVDVGNEVKLGGNAVCLLALTKYTELTGDRQYEPLLERLALGIGHMQDARTGRFVHVLNHPKLDVKTPFRIIYYDGEAAFGLMRLYGLTRDPRWLAMVEKAFEHFIAAKHWEAHDHWLSYCVNELTRYKPDVRYYRFGLQNVAGYLDFVLERITTFPTLLELMMAARDMLERIEADPALRPLLEGFDRAKFDRALEHRARYLANGHFWPELAMFFRNPGRIAGSFFIKHHGFRVRIDDVEHYLSGYVAYWKHLASRDGADASALPPRVRIHRRTQKPLQAVFGFCAAALMALSVHAPARAQAADPDPGRCRSGADMQSRLDRTLAVDEFRIRYASQGPDALVDATDANGNGVPDAIDDMATQLRAARTFYTEVLGLRHPLQQPRYQRAKAIDVFVVAMERGNGLAFDEVSYEKRLGAQPVTECALSVSINSKLQPSRNITPAHELFHLFQYGYAMFKTRWYLEGMTRWMETAFVDSSTVTLDRDAARIPSSTCSDVVGLAYEAAPYWRARSRAAGPSSAVTVPDGLLSRTYLNGVPVFSHASFLGGRFVRPALEGLQRRSAESAASAGLPLYNWPEDVQKSARFDSLICEMADGTASTFR